VRIIIGQAQILRLLIRYLYLHVRYVQLHIRYYLLKLAGAALVEAVKMEYCIKSLSKDDRVIFATCITVPVYLLVLSMLIRI
jgi:hypothetical protein